MASEEGINTELITLQKKKKEVNYRVEVVNRTENEDKSDLAVELAAEKKKNENLSLIVEMEAEKKFLSDKANLLKDVPQDRRDKISDFIGEDSDKMAQIQASLIISGQDNEDFYDDNRPAPTSPAGKVGLVDSQNQSRETRRVRYQNPAVQKFSDLYGVLRSPTSSEQEKNEANQILDDAFVEIGKGLRSRSRNNPYSLPSGCVSHCMKCGKIVEMDLGTGKPCPYCNHRFGIDKFPRNPKFAPR